MSVKTNNFIYRIVKFISILLFASVTTADMTCSWDLPSYSRILKGKMCTEQICSAYVICQKNGIIKKRLATCSADLCGQNSATNCAVQKGFGSIALDFNSQNLKSESIKNMNSKPASGNSSQ